MKFGEPSRPTYSRTQLMGVAWAIVLAAVCFYAGLVLGIAGVVPEEVGGVLAIGGWAALPLLAAWQAYRLERTAWLWFVAGVVGSPISQVFIAGHMFLATRRWCSRVL